MPSTRKKQCDQSSVISSITSVDNCSLQWIPNNSQPPHSSLSNHHNLGMKASPKKYFDVKELHNQDSSPAQSTDRSHHEVGNAGGNLDGEHISSQSGYTEAYGQQMKNNESIFPQGTPSFSFTPSQSMVLMPYPCADPHYGGFQHAIGTIMHPHLGGMVPGRVPLPPDFGEDGPIYVNSKQYHGILRRRQTRAKLEAQNKLLKDRKPYLHESRHLHALKRARGGGGRFLKKKNLEQSNETGANSNLETDKMRAAITSHSVNDNLNQPLNPWLSGYHHPHMNETVQNGGGGNIFGASQFRVPVIQ
ncbi:hypothetical protein ACHQM5_029354 [Ranunculus cassubicifolius]